MRRSAATRGDIFPGLDHLHEEVRGRLQLQGRFPLQEWILIPNAAHHINSFLSCDGRLAAVTAVLLGPVSERSARLSHDASECRADLLVWGGGDVEQTAAHIAILSENE